jgi:STE24 endopeptidase
VNESRSSRYHRLKRRGGVAQGVLAASILVALLASGGSSALREWMGGSPGAYALVLVLALELAVLPVAWYRTFVIERTFGLVRASIGHWARDYLQGVALTLAAAVSAAELLYRAMSAWPQWWWAPASAAGAALAAGVLWLAPVAILPLFRPSRPLQRETLRHRLFHLSRRLGIEMPAVHEWRSARHEDPAHAAIVGLGATRRILLSSTLLEDYSDDEIEVVVAHEIAHQVHRDAQTLLGIRCVLLAGGLLAAWGALERLWLPLGFTSPRDPAGLPLVLLLAAGIQVLATPLLNACSRHHERRADRFALGAAARPEAFVSAVRRMAAHNLVEEHPSRVAYWLFHSHPTVEERMAAAASAPVFPARGQI